MSRVRTLRALIEETRQRGDLRPSRHPDAQLIRNINASILELFGLLVELNQDYYIEFSTISVKISKDVYSLHRNYYKTLGVDVLDGNTWYPMRRFIFSERNQSQHNGSDRRETRYRVMGSSLRLRPIPGWSGKIRHWYVPLPKELDEMDDNFDGIAGWEEYVILDCMCKAKVRDDYDITEVAAQKGALIKRIRDQAIERDVGEPDHVRDVWSEG